MIDREVCMVWNAKTIDVELQMHYCVIFLVVFVVSGSRWWLMWFFTPVCNTSSKNKQNTSWFEYIKVGDNILSSNAINLCVSVNLSIFL